MTSSIAIHPHETVILSLSNSNHAVQITALEERIKKEVILGLPMLSAEWSVSELHIVRGFDVVIWKLKGFIVPRIIRVLVPRPKVTQFGLCPWVLHHSFDELIVTLTLEDDGDGNGQVQFGLPSE